jgi:hypothetical protein
MNKKAAFFDQFVIPRLNYASILFSWFSILSEAGDLCNFRLPGRQGAYSALSILSQVTLAVII